MSVAPAIYSQITGAAPVAALIGTRCYPQLSPENRSFPLVVYDIGDGEEPEGYGGDCTMVKRNFTLICVATTYAAVDDLASKCKTALDNGSGTWGGVTVLGCWWESQADDVTTVGDDAAARYYIIEQQYLIWHR